MQAILLVAFLLATVFCEEMAITQEHTDYLKAHATWEVADYEDNIFRGWSMNEVSGMFAGVQPESDMPSRIESVLPGEKFPENVNWNQLRADCVHTAGDQKSCGSSWAFSAVGTVSDRCCLRLKDYGWLSVQELISCDNNDDGCKGGMPTDVFAWAVATGIVTEKCYPYKAREESCPTKCVDGSDWTKAHVCKCKAKVICKGAEAMKKCIQTGPISTLVNIYTDFMYYKGGIYHTNTKSQMLGLHTLRCYGYSDKLELYWICANSWGTNWGENGSINYADKGSDMSKLEAAYCDPSK